MDGNGGSEFGGNQQSAQRTRAAAASWQPQRPARRMVDGRLANVPQTHGRNLLREAAPPDVAAARASTAALAGHDSFEGAGRSRKGGRLGREDHDQALRLCYTCASRCSRGIRTAHLGSGRLYVCCVYRSAASGLNAVGSENGPPAGRPRWEG